MQILPLIKLLPIFNLHFLHTHKNLLVVIKCEPQEILNGNDTADASTMCTKLSKRKPCKGQSLGLSLELVQSQLLVMIKFECTSLTYIVKMPVCSQNLLYIGLMMIALLWRRWWNRKPKAVMNSDLGKHQFTKQIFSSN